MDVVVFRLGPQQFGIPVGRVRQVFPVAEITPQSDAPIPVRGVVDIHGDVTPVIDLGRRFAGAWTELRLEQHFILVDGATQQLALLAEDVEGVIRIPDSAVADMATLLPDAGVAVYDLDTLR
jgi:purine-binding chemotaxis protein CheW